MSVTNIKAKTINQLPALLICPETGADIELNFEEITPAKANIILNNNHQSNRTIKRNTVDGYAAQMERGEWHPSSAEAIKLTSTGKLIDGQHRLHACIKANVPVTFLVIKGIPECAFTAIDDGTVRTLQDALQISGVNIKGGLQKASHCLSILMQLKESLDKGIQLSNLKRSKPSITHAINFHKTLNKFNESSAKFSDLYLLSNIQKNFNPPVLMAIYYLFNGIDEATDNALHTVVMSLETGTPFDDLKNLSPSYHVIQYVREKREHKSIIRFSEYMSLFLWALDKTLQGEPIKTMPKTQIDFLSYKLEAKRIAIKRLTDI